MCFRAAAIKGSGNWNSTWLTGAPNQVVTQCDISNPSHLDFILWEGNYFNGNLNTNGINKFLNVVKLTDTRVNSVDYIPGSVNSMAPLQPIYIRHCELTISVYENSGTAQSMDIYEFVAARDIPKGDPYYSPYAAWTQCITDAQPLTLTAMTLLS